MARIDKTHHLDLLIACQSIDGRWHGLYCPLNEAGPPE